MRENKTSRDELTDKQREDLNNIRNNIKKKVKDIDREELIYQKQYTASLIMLYVLMTFFILVVVYGLSTTSADEHTISKISNCDTIINIDMNNETNKLEYNIESLAVKTNDNKYINFRPSWIKLDINTDSTEYIIKDNKYTISHNLNLSNLSLKDEEIYIQYSNIEETASKELIVAKSKPTYIDTSNLQKITSRFNEKSNPSQVITTANSYNNIFIMITETLAGGELKTESLKREIIKAEEHMQESTNNNGFTLQLKGIGNINLSNTTYNILYTNKDEVLRVHNNEKDEDSFHIFSINNETMGCNAEDLIATQNKKLFVHSKFNDETSSGYKTIGLLSEDSLYCIKFYNEDIQKHVLKQLGIDCEQINIKKIQSVVEVKEGK